MRWGSIVALLIVAVVAAGIVRDAQPSVQAQESTPAATASDMPSPAYVCRESLRLLKQGAHVRHGIGITFQAVLVVLGLHFDL